MNSWNNQNFQIGMAQPIVMDNAPPIAPAPVAPLIGPIVPDNVPLRPQNEAAEADSPAEGVSSSENQKRRSRSHDRSNRRDRERNVPDRPRQRTRSRERREVRDRSDRNDRNRRDRRSRERRTKWGDQDTIPMGGPSIAGMPMGNMMMPVSGMMQYMNIMGQQPMEQMPMMSAMNVMPNMMPIMDQNLMMLNQQLMPMMPHQQICTSGGIFLPPLPGVTTPTRRDRPKGCRTIFVGGLPHNITEETLNEIFQRFGNVIEIKTPRRGVFYVRFERQESVEQSFHISGYRFRFHDQIDSEATTMFIDFAKNREDQIDYEKTSHKRPSSPHRVEPFTPSAMASVTEKIKSEDDFVNVAPTLATWLERGECNKKNANAFYSLVQASNNQVRRLFSEKMQLDDELLNMKSAIKEKFILVLKQFEQVAKILSAAKHQRVSDHFTKQQRRNIDMWMKMTEELENMKEELNATFDEDEGERSSKSTVSLEKYEELKRENENLTYELEGYKNEAYLAKNEAERKFETFKAHFVAQQALQNKNSYPSMLKSITKRNETITSMSEDKTKPLSTLNPPLLVPSVVNDDKVITTGPSVPPSEAKLISILTAFLMVHPLGASLDYLVSYVKSMTPSVTQATVLSTLEKYTDVFVCKTTGVGASIEHKWSFVTFDVIKTEM